MMRGTQKFSKNGFYCSLLDTYGLVHQYEQNMRSYRDDLLENEDSFDEEDEGSAQKPHQNLPEYHFRQFNLEKHAGQRLGTDGEQKYDYSVGESDKLSSSESDDEQIDDDSDANISHEDIDEIDGEVNRVEAYLDVPIAYRHNVQS